jgi:O-methyltransferase involved in polyketide biosynthesis
MAVVAQRPGPHLFLADGVLPYLDEEDAHRVLAAISREFPGGLLGFDTCGSKMIATQDRHDSMGKMTARMRWVCDIPAQLQRQGLTLRQSRTLAQAPRPIHTRLSYRDRLILRVASIVDLRGFNNYRVNLFRAEPT